MNNNEEYFSYRNVADKAAFLTVLEDRLLNDDKNKISFMGYGNSVELVIDSVEFPSIPNEKYLTNLISRVSTSLATTQHNTLKKFPDVVVFSNCVFEDVKVSLETITKAFNFKKCRFNGEFSVLHTKKLSLSNCSFQSMATFTAKGINAQIDFDDVTFASIVDFNNYNFKSNKFFDSTENTGSAFNKVVFYESVRFAEVSFAKDVQLSRINWSYVPLICDRETYRQLKVCMDEYKNHIDEAFFHSLEMNAYREELKKEGWTWKNWQDRLIFNISKYTSNFSQSWLLPLIWMFGITLILYLYMCIDDMTTIPMLTAHCTVESFLKLFNPFSLNNNYFESHYVTWLAHKLIMVYLSYQFIVALRRKTKF